MRKTHKKLQPGMEIVGPATRPVVAANSAPNSRLSDHLSDMIDNFCDMTDNEYECKNSEEMREGFERFNAQYDSTTKQKFFVLSMDVKALFPNMQVGACMKAVHWMVDNSEVTIKNVNWWEVSKYISVCYSDEEIREYGLRSVCPERVLKSRVKLTMNCLSNEAAKKDDEKWTKVDIPNEEQKKKMIALVLAYGVKVTITNHCYRVGDDFYQQSSGGPIGLDLTRALHRPFMRWYNARYVARVIEAGFTVGMLEIFVDDSDQIMMGREGQTKEDAIKELNEIANSIEEHIVMEVDIGDNHQSGKLPILDMQVWQLDNGDVVYQHYEKPVASKLLISSRSAHSANSKRSVHVSEIVRRLCNTSRQLDWDEFFVPVLNDYMLRMCQAGYSQQYRRNVLLNALAVYDKKLMDNDNGVMPLNRPIGYMKAERRKMKKQKKRDWGTRGGYIAPIIVPATPNSQLAKEMKVVAESLAECGIRFKIVEKGGITLGRMLQKSNPTSNGSCNKSDCLMCQHRGRGCHKMNIVYQYKCNQDESVYIGETSRNFYSRNLEHQDKYDKKKAESFLYQHQLEAHGGAEPDVNVKVLKSFRDPMSRQIFEGVKIRRSNSNMNTQIDFYKQATYNVSREIRHG